MADRTGQWRGRWSLRTAWVVWLLGGILWPVAAVRAQDERGSPAGLAERIIGSAKAARGLCVHLGVGDGTLTAALARRGEVAPRRAPLRRRRASEALRRRNSV